MNTNVPSEASERLQLPVVVFSMGLATLVLLLITLVINVSSLNDFPREAWDPYLLLEHGHVVAFLRGGAYVGSLLLRAPFALPALLLGAGQRATYIAAALPCLLGLALLVGWLANERPCFASGAAANPRRLWPLDLFMLTPAAIICLAGGHPEDFLGAALCVAAVLLAQRGRPQIAAVMLGVALINKSWALVAAPLVIALMPTGRRKAGLATTVAVTALVILPVVVAWMAGSGELANGLGVNADRVALIPQLLWFFGPNSWVDQHGHIILVLVAWLVTAAWWWRHVHGVREAPSAGAALTILALVFFLRAVLDPWDNGYYFVPFMLAIMAVEDRSSGFPKLSWAFAIMLVIVVPPHGFLKGLGQNGHAAVFAVWALAAIAYLGRRAFGAPGPRTRAFYAGVSRSRA